MVSPAFRHSGAQNKVPITGYQRLFAYSDGNRRCDVRTSQALTRGTVLPSETMRGHVQQRGRAADRSSGDVSQG